MPLSTGRILPVRKDYEISRLLALHAVEHGYCGLWLQSSKPYRSRASAVLRNRTTYSVLVSPYLTPYSYSTEFPSLIRAAITVQKDDRFVSRHYIIALAIAQDTELGTAPVGRKIFLAPRQICPPDFKTAHESLQPVRCVLLPVISIRNCSQIQPPRQALPS